MIRVEVESYCNNGCRAFEADVEIPTRFYGIPPSYETNPINDTIIRCANRNLCKQLVRYLERSNNHAK